MYIHLYIYIFAYFSYIIIRFTYIYTLLYLSIYLQIQIYIHAETEHSTIVKSNNYLNNFNYPFTNARGLTLFTCIQIPHWP